MLGCMYPFERFTERAKKVLTHAQAEAERSHHSYIGTEHLLLGLMRERDGVAAHVLQSLGVTLDKVRSQVDSFLKSGGAEPSGPKPTPPPKPYDEVVTAILNAAEDAAEKEHAAMFRLDHLLSALVARRGAPPAALDLLRAAGVNLDLLRKMLRPPPRVTRMEAALDQLRRRVAQAAAGQDTELVARLRQEENGLRAQVAAALASWQASWKVVTP